MPTTSDATTSTRIEPPVRRGASRRLARVLREQLHEGVFGPGDRLPTHRQLMQQFNVGYSVANRAMEILAREGLVERQQGQGSFVSEKASDAPGSSRLEAFALVLGHSRWSFYPTLFQGLELGTAAGGLHYQTIVCDTENDVNRQAAILMQLIDKRVAGIALVPATEPETPGYQIRLCQQCGIPVVLLHRNVKGVSAPLISLPFEEIAYNAGRALRDQGHRRVACVFSGRGGGAMERCEAGLRRALEEGGGLPELSVHWDDKWTMPVPPEHERFLEELLDGMFRTPAQRRPTAILAYADGDAEWIYVRLMKMGVRVPDEISLITVGSPLRRREIDRQLSAVTIDEMGVGQLAARLLAEMGKQERPIDDSQQFTAELGFHSGETLGPAPRVAEQAMKE